MAGGQRRQMRARFGDVVLKPRRTCKQVKLILIILLFYKLINYLNKFTFNY
jgi:hypothetical protein